MKKFMKSIKKALKNFADFYVDAMIHYGDAINNSRGLVGA